MIQNSQGEINKSALSVTVLLLLLVLLLVLDPVLRAKTEVSPLDTCNYVHHCRPELLMRPPACVTAPQGRQPLTENHCPLLGCFQQTSCEQTVAPALCNSAFPAKILRRLRPQMGSKQCTV